MEVLRTDFFLARPSRKMLLVVFVVREMVMVTYSGSVLLPSSMSGDLPDFAIIMSLNRSNCPRFLLWHGWLPGLSGLSDKNPWASSFGDYLPRPTCGKQETCC